MTRPRRAAIGALTLLPFALEWSAGCGRPADDDPGALTVGGRAARPDEAPAPGKWHRRPDDHARLTAEQLEEIRRLESIGYVSGFREGSGLGGVVRHDPERAYRGLNLVLSAHGPEATLIDMDGRVLHRWRRSFGEIWPRHPAGDVGDTWGAQYWRRVHLEPDGDLIVIFAGRGVARLNARSEPVWATAIQAHHDLEVLPDGTIWVLTRGARVIPRLDPERPVLEDFISRLDASGRETLRVSLLECFERSRYAEIWRRGPRRFGDIFHTNTLTLLDGRGERRNPELRAGRFLVSMRVLDAIAVVDLERREVVWALQGDFGGQHDPTVVAGGDLLLFDNYGRPERERSRVLEIDPGDGSIVWSWEGGEDRPLYSRYNGTSARLPNGNTLVNESNAGRAYEVTPEGEIVWEFHNPHVAGPDGEFVATLMDLIRLPPDFPVGWAEATD